MILYERIHIYITTPSLHHVIFFAYIFAHQFLYLLTDLYLQGKAHNLPLIGILAIDSKTTTKLKVVLGSQNEYAHLDEDLLMKPMYVQLDKGYFIVMHPLLAHAGTSKHNLCE